MGTFMTKDNWIKALAEQFIGDINQETYKLLEAFISQVEKDAIEKTNKRWVSAVINQPPMFLKNSIVDIIESDRDRKVRRVRCVEILREMGFTKEADKLLEETRKLSDLLEEKK